MPDKPKLIIGQTYAVEITLKGWAQHDEQGKRINVAPTIKTTKSMRLVEKQGNGVCVMEQESWRLLDGPFTGRADHKWAKSHQLVKVKAHQLKALA